MLSCCVRFRATFYLTLHHWKSFEYLFQSKLCFRVQRLWDHSFLCSGHVRSRQRVPTVEWVYGQSLEREREVTSLTEAGILWDVLCICSFHNLLSTPLHCSPLLLYSNWILQLRGNWGRGAAHQSPFRAAKHEERQGTVTSCGYCFPKLWAWDTVEYAYGQHTLKQSSYCKVSSFSFYLFLSRQR